MREMYDSIMNPLDDDAVISDLITLYAGINYYGRLMRAHSSDKKHLGYYRPMIRDELYAKLFKIWKENVLSLTEGQVNRLIQDNIVGQDYHQLRSYLQIMPDIKTYKEFRQLKKENDLIEKYNWQNFVHSPGWTYIRSRDLTVRKEKKIKVEHRLYLNTESADMEAVASLFVDKCMERNIPFCFKYGELGDRDDTIVIYSDTEHLEQYIEILRELKKENAELFSRVHKPPMLTGKIDGWVGYGAEPQLLPNGQKTSFNIVRSKVIEKGIAQALNDWIYTHQNTLISHKGKKMTFSEYLAIKVTDKVVMLYKESFDSYSKRGNLQKFYDWCGLVPQDFTQERLWSLRKVIEHGAKQIIATTFNSKSNQKVDRKIAIPTRNGKKIHISNNNFEEVFREIIKQIESQDPSFKKAVKDAIIRESKTMGIDTDKFCFDILSRDKLLSYQRQEQDTVTEYKEVSQQPQISSQIQENNNSHQTTTSNSRDGYIVDVSTICDKLNPTLLERSLKYPNGAETSAKQYIQEYLYPFIPEDGFFTLKNGTRIPYVQYIETFVMFEGQTKYNGDIARLLEATTKRNRDLVTIKNDAESVSVNPVEITNYLNPTLLKRSLKYPNGAETSAKQYIQEYLYPFIPEDGFFTLKSGTRIPCVQYIETFVMFEGQAKYNGDIARLLEATTINNNGKIEFDWKKELQKRIELEAKLSEIKTQSMSGSGIKR